MLLTKTNQVGEFIEVEDTMEDGQIIINKRVDGMHRMGYPIDNMTKGANIMWSILKKS
jgi:hypothetical protein